MRDYSLGTLYGLRLTTRPAFFISTLLTWIVFVAIGLALLNLNLIESLVGGFVAVMLHWATELLHHVGHAWAARRTGYPMTGVRLGFLIGMSLYPHDEPSLPASVHIHRALGGPAASLLLSAVAAILLFVVRALGGIAWWLALFLLLDNFLNVLQIFIPLGFNDGSTLFHWLRKR